MATHDYRVTNYGYIHSHKEEDFNVFLKTIDPKDGDVILDAFCGYGETTQKLIAQENAEKISCTHYLSDASETQVKRAVAVLGDELSVKSIEVADARDLPYDDEMFDIVVVKMGFHEVSKEMQEKIMKEIFRVLKTGGKFVTWEIALSDDTEVQKVFRDVIYRKNELAGFYEINRSRYFQTEKGLLELFQKTGFSKHEKVHDIRYLFESIRRREELVSVETKMITDAKGILGETEQKFLTKLAEYRLQEFNKSIREIIGNESLKQKVSFKETSIDNLSFLANKAIFYAVK